MVEESEERLSEEQIEELIQTVAGILPGDPEKENAAPADTEMAEASEQSWCFDGLVMARTVGWELDWSHASVKVLEQETEVIYFCFLSHL